jgi:tol-pal system protein YbgF
MNKKTQLQSGLARLGLTCFILLAFQSAVQAEPDPALDKLPDKQRIQRLERIVSSDVMLQQANTIKQLQQEISGLREKLEQQNYELESMKQRQRNLYVDMDRRINNIEAGGGSGTGHAAPVPPPNAGQSATMATPALPGDKDGQEEYSAAFNLLKDGQYQQSIAAFEKFKTQYPDSKYADNAQYWLGEANYVSREYKKALDAFQQLIARYPNSSKIPGARLKIGYVYFELQNWSAAREALQQVIKLYPGQTVAKKADERLQRMKREGH